MFNEYLQVSVCTDDGNVVAEICICWICLDFLFYYYITYILELVKSFTNFSIVFSFFECNRAWYYAYWCVCLCTTHLNLCIVIKTFSNNFQYVFKMCIFKNSHVLTPEHRLNYYFELLRYYLWNIFVTRKWE